MGEVLFKPLDNFINLESNLVIGKSDNFHAKLFDDKGSVDVVFPLTLMYAPIDFNDELSLFAVEVGYEKPLIPIHLKFDGMLPIETEPVNFPVPYELPEFGFGGRCVTA